MKVKILLGIVLLVLPLPFAYAEDDSCSNAVTTTEINGCVKGKLDAADQKMNATYRQVMDLLSQPDGLGRSQEFAKKNLIKAQRHWVNLRDIDCDVVLFLNADGTIRTSLYLQCKVEMTLERENHLRNWFLHDLTNAR